MLRELLIQMGYVTNSKLLKQNKRAWLLQTTTEPEQLSYNLRRVQTMHQRNRI